MVIGFVPKKGTEFACRKIVRRIEVFCDEVPWPCHAHLGDMQKCRSIVKYTVFLSFTGKDHLCVRSVFKRIGFIFIHALGNILE